MFQLVLKSYKFRLNDFIVLEEPKTNTTLFANDHVIRSPESSKSKKIMINVAMQTKLMKRCKHTNNASKSCLERKNYYSELQ